MSHGETCFLKKQVAGQDKVRNLESMKCMITSLNDCLEIKRILIASINTAKQKDGQSNDS